MTARTSTHRTPSRAGRPRRVQWVLGGEGLSGAASTARLKGSLRPAVCAFSPPLCVMLVDAAGGSGRRTRSASQGAPGDDAATGGRRGPSAEQEGGTTPHDREGGGMAERNDRDVTPAADDERSRDAREGGRRSDGPGARTKSNRGFASMDPARQREIASKG